MLFSAAAPYSADFFVDFPIRHPVRKITLRLRRVDEVLIVSSSSSLRRISVSDPSLIETGAVMLRWQVSSSVFAGIVLLITVLFESMEEVHKEDG